MNPNPRRPTLASLRFEFFLRKHEKSENLKGFAPTTCYLVGARRYHYTTCEQAKHTRKNTFLCIQSASHLESGLVTKQNRKVSPKYFAYGMVREDETNKTVLREFLCGNSGFSPPNCWVNPWEIGRPHPVQWRSNK
jgi:hypothetical protein